MHVGATHFGALRAQQGGTLGKIRAAVFTQLDRPARRRHHGGENRFRHAVYVILERMLIQTASALWLIAALAAPQPTAPAQQYQPQKARRHFVSVSYERQFVQPYGFGKHPLSELLGQQVNEVPLQNFQYETQDQKTQVTVLEYGKRASAVGATLYPFGSSVGA